MKIGLEAIALSVKAIASRLEAAIGVEVITICFEGPSEETKIRRPWSFRFDLA